MFTSTFEVKHKYIAKVEHLAMMCSTDIEDHIRVLLKNKGWQQNIYEYFCERIYSILDKFIITYEDAKLCEADLAHMVKQKKRNDKVFTKLLNQSYFNFFDIVLKDRKVKFLKNIELLKEIYKLRYDGIGLGEVFLTLFSECESSEKGDIIVDNKIVELKGERGYIGVEGLWSTTLKIIKYEYSDKLGKQLSYTTALKEYLKHLNTIKNPIKLLYSLRTDGCTPQHQKIILSQIKEMLKFTKIDDILLFAIQIYTYHINLSFDYLIFIHEDKAACIKYSNSIKDIYDQLLQFNFSLQVSSNLNRGKGYSVLLKGKLNNHNEDI